jgi:tyrosine-protein phosphatase SIW14
VPKPFPDSYIEFMENSGIHQIVVQIPANKEVVCMDAATMMKALGVVLDRTNYPLLIHCNKGKHRTGCTVACLRKVQGESRVPLLNEYQTYAGSKVRTLDIDFIEGFDERALLWLGRQNKLIPEHEPTIESPLLSASMLPSRMRG